MGLYCIHLPPQLWQINMHKHLTALYIREKGFMNSMEIYECISSMVCVCGLALTMCWSIRLDLK